MLKKLVISTLIVVLLAFTTFGQSVSLRDRRISQGIQLSSAHVIAMNTASVGQLTAQVDNISETKAMSANLNPQEINAQLLVDAGRALKNFRDNYYLAWLVQVGGLALTMIGALTYPPNAGLIVVGYVAVLVGDVWQFLSFNSIGVAGDRLEKAGRGY